MVAECLKCSSTEDSPRFPRKAFFYPATSFCLSACPTAEHGQMPTQGKNLALFRGKLPCTQEALLKDFMVHCMGQSHQPPVDHSTNKTWSITLKTRFIPETWCWKVKTQKYLRNRGISSDGSEMMVYAHSIILWNGCAPKACHSLKSISLLSATCFSGCYISNTKNHGERRKGTWSLPHAATGPVTLSVLPFNVDFVLTGYDMLRDSYQQKKKMLPDCFFNSYILFWHDNSPELHSYFIHGAHKNSKEPPWVSQRFRFIASTDQSWHSPLKTKQPDKKKSAYCRQSRR